MHLSGKHILRRVPGRKLPLLLILMIIGWAALPALADAGTLGVTAPTLAWSLTLNGLNSAGNAGTTTTTVSDATGTGVGWNVTVSASTFTAGSHTLPSNVLSVNGSSTNALSVVAPAATCSGTCTLPAGGATISYPLSIPTGSVPPTVKIYSAGAASGMGTVDLATYFWMAIPANAYQGTYTSTVTFAAVSGP